MNPRNPVPVPYSCGHTVDTVPYDGRGVYTPESIQRYVDWKKKDICPACIQSIRDKQYKEAQAERAMLSKIARKMAAIFVKHGFPKARPRDHYVSIGDFDAMAYRRFDGTYEFLDCKIDLDKISEKVWVDRLNNKMEKWKLEVAKQEQARIEAQQKESFKAKVLAKIVSASRDKSAITLSTEEVQILNEYLESDSGCCCGECECY